MGNQFRNLLLISIFLSEETKIPMVLIYIYIIYIVYMVDYIIYNIKGGIGL